MKNKLKNQRTQRKLLVCHNNRMALSNAITVIVENIK
jgi:hypothetical protein